MKIYYNTSFDGKWPVPTAAIVRATNAQEAADMLNAELKTMGLPQPERLTAEDMTLFDSKESVVILSDGEY